MKIALLLLVIFSQNSLFSKTWYVSPSGNDNATGTLAAPFKTIPKAIDEAAPGDEIQLRGGTYVSKEIRITKSNLTIRSYPGEWAKIACGLNVEDESSCIWYSEPDVVGGLLENLEITGGYYYGIKFETNWDWGLPPAEIHGVRNVTVRNCKIHDTGRDCIKITPACNGLQFISCEIYNSGVGPSNLPANGGPNAEGIDNVNGDGMVVRNCYIHHTSTSGVYAKGGAKDCIIEENLVMNTGEAGILLGFYTDAEFFDQDGTNPAFYECQYSLARNNIVENTGGAGIGFFAARNCAAYNNTVITASPEFHAPLMIAKGEIWINDNLTLTPANFNILVFNNIFIDKSGTSDEDYTVQIREGALTGTNSFSRNIYQKTTGAAKFDDGVSWPALNFSQWKSQLGFDVQSMETDPKLDANFHLTAASPAINAGQNSPAVKDYDAKTRSDGSVDIGADEFGNGTSLVVPPPAGTVGTGAGGTVIASKEVDFQRFASVFPNPASDFVFVKFEKNTSPAALRLTLFDAIGNQMRTLENGRLTLDNQLFDVRGLPAGVYFLQIETENSTFAQPIFKL